MPNPSVASQPLINTDGAIRHAPQHKAPEALAVDQLRRSYGEMEAVKGISFEIHEGEVFGLLGPNGAGKTTTISVLSTQLRPSSGDARVLGRSVRDNARAVRPTIGVVPQEISMYPALTAAENVRFFGRMYGIQPATLDQRVESLLELVGLQGRRDDPAGTFSGGMKRRLNLAVSLVHQPRVLLLDEPTAGVDPHSRQHIFDIIRDLRRQGTAILYTTHYMEEAEALCDRLAILDEGKIVAMGTLEQLLTTMRCTETIQIRGVPATEVTGRLGSYPAVTHVEVDGETARVFVRRSTDLLGPLQKLLEKHDGASLQISPMSLGDLFLHLTGKELRD